MEGEQSEGDFGMSRECQGGPVLDKLRERAGGWRWGAGIFWRVPYSLQRRVAATGAPGKRRLEGIRSAHG
jgi:hypothetical protein